MSKGYLTTHVLDTFNGSPGSGINGCLYKLEYQNKTKILDFELNSEGRTDNPILADENFIIGRYELVFYCGDYFKNFTDLNKPYFLDDVVIRFGINDLSQHYHVPLLVSPWSYTTYRGS